MDENLHMIAKIDVVWNGASIAHSKHQYVSTGSLRPFPLIKAFQLLYVCSLNNLWRVGVPWTIFALEQLCFPLNLCLGNKYSTGRLINCIGHLSFDKLHRDFHFGC